MSAQRLALACILALAVLQPVWHAWLSPPRTADPVLAALLFSLPILPALALGVVGHRRTAFWGAVAALLYFCHGITEAWGGPEARVLAAVEIALSVLLIVAASWDGMRARFAKRRDRA
ncbi:DUF2069 domain-containing protein [Coralloluteibacterium stylophorae]|uniref:DUF2069 domain-containing protein n=1 Tax=Coralloluteibacterium stylophorae TaxID=1776034 RepID=A0A8J7VW52_9GAMM|nr:DUF2069 domain-containing protein [Coralloluteibacterium stylophorae]